jgi:CDP-glucose 4,6-dehydratase
VPRRGKPGDWWSGNQRTCRELDDHFWRHRMVLITRHTGFVGGWVSACLHILHADVVGFSLPPQTDRTRLLETAYAC